MSTGAAPQLPDFAGKQCEFLIVCGNFALDADIPLTGFTDKEHWDYAQYKRSNKTVRAAVGRNSARRGTGKGPHLHINLTTEDWQSVAKKRPEKIMSKDELSAILSPLIGFDYGADVKGFFTASREELPPVIRYAMAPAQADGVELEMVSGSYAVRGAPIHMIRWFLPGEEKEQFAVVLDALVTEPFGPNYFVDALDMLERAFGALFHKEQGDG